MVNGTFWQSKSKKKEAINPKKIKTSDDLKPNDSRFIRKIDEHYVDTGQYSHDKMQKRHKFLVEQSKKLLNQYGKKK